MTLRKEVYITKLPAEVSMDEFLENLLQTSDGSGFDNRTKEAVDERLRDMGIREAVIKAGTYYQITVEEVA